MNWYYESQGQQQGPVSEAELDRLLAEGKITNDTLVWREGMTAWTPLATARKASLAPGAGNVRCDACGGWFPSSEVVAIGGRNICANCKPSVAQSLQTGGALPVATELDRTGPPWEQRETLGLTKAAWETVKSVLMQPSETFGRMKRTGGLGAPLLFNVIVGSLGAIVGVLWQVLFEVAGGIAGGTADSHAGGAAVGFVIGVGVWVVLMPVLIALGAFISSGITHVSLMICGGAKQPFETTFRVLNYASGSVALLQLVPVCGAIAGGIWGLIVTCLGLSKAHEIGAGRALLALLLPTIVCLGLFIFAFIWGYGMYVATQGSGSH